MDSADPGISIQAVITVATLYLASLFRPLVQRPNLFALWILAIVEQLPHIKNETSQFHRCGDRLRYMFHVRRNDTSALHNRFHSA